MDTDKPPGDADGFLAYAQQLRTPTIYNAIRRAERLGEIARFGLPASVRRHFERIEAFRRGLLPIGDAMCRFNNASAHAIGGWITTSAVSALSAILKRMQAPLYAFVPVKIAAKHEAWHPNQSIWISLIAAAAGEREPPARHLDDHRLRNCESQP